MWPFKRKGDVIDLGQLHERGILKVKDSEIGESDYKELGVKDSKSNFSSEQEKKTSVFDFLGNLASSANSLKAENSETELEEIHNKDYHRNMETKNKLEDVEFKLESLSKRLNSLMDRIDLIEKKIDRFERGH